MIKVSDYISNFISKLGVKHVFTVSGAGDLHIIDSIRKHNNLDFICNNQRARPGYDPVIFTEEQVRAVCKVGGRVYV